MSFHTTLPYLPIVLVAALSLISFYAGQLHLKTRLTKKAVKAFAAGLSLTYLFIVLLPELLSNPTISSRALFLFVVSGFALFQISEAFVYQHSKGRKRRRQLKIEHTIVFSIYHAIIGLAVLVFFKEGISQMLFFFIPISIHILATNNVLHELHGKTKGAIAQRVIIAFAPLAGLILGLLMTVPQWLFLPLMGVVAGALFFVVMEELIPDRKNGSPLWFVIGIIGFMLIEEFLRSVLK